jgi:hypothetical protein
VVKDATQARTRAQTLVAEVMLMTSVVQRAEDFLLTFLPKNETAPMVNRGQLGHCLST